MLLRIFTHFLLVAMYVNSLCACSRSEAMKGSSSLRLLILSRLLASPFWAQLTLTDPTWGPGPFTSKMATLSTGSAHTPLLGSRTSPSSLVVTILKINKRGTCDFQHHLIPASNFIFSNLILTSSKMFIRI
jgi:hypothetical protein